MGAFAAVAQGSVQSARLIRLDYDGPGSVRERRRLAPDRQGRDVRLWRPLAQAGGVDARDEVRHVRRRRGDRGGRSAGRAAGAGAGDGARRRDREPARRRPRSSQATSSARSTAPRSRSTTPTPRAGSCSSDCITYALREGAERLVDIATLTGARRGRAGPHVRRPDEQRRRVGAHGRGLRPRHRRAACGGCRCTTSTREMVKGRYAQLTNLHASAARPARSPPPSCCTTSPATCRGRTSTSPAPPGTCGVPTSTSEATGFGVRLLVEIARRLAEDVVAGELMQFELLRRPSPAARHRSRVRPPGDRAGRRGARPHAIVPVRDRQAAGRARPDGDPVPRGVRRRRRRLAGVRAGGRGADARRLVGRDHAVRPHVAGDPADLPVRLRGSRSASGCRCCAAASGSARSG